jgi:hypothetical protein
MSQPSTAHLQRFIPKVIVLLVLIALAAAARRTYVLTVAPQTPVLPPPRHWMRVSMHIAC